MEKSGERVSKHGEARTTPDIASVDNKPKTLEGLGVSDQQSSRWQVIASISESEFDRHIKEARAKKG